MSILEINHYPYTFGLGLSSKNLPNSNRYSSLIHKHNDIACFHAHASVTRYIKRGCLSSFSAPKGSTEGSAAYWRHRRTCRCYSSAEETTINQPVIGVHPCCTSVPENSYTGGLCRLQTCFVFSCRCRPLRHPESPLPCAPRDGGMISASSPPSPPLSFPHPAPPAVGLRVHCQSSELRPGCGPRCIARLRCLRPFWRWAPASQVRRCCWGSWGWCLWSFLQTAQSLTLSIMLLLLHEGVLPSQE